MVRMSVCPSTATPCWHQTCSVVRAWTASTSPACTEVIRWGARTEWKILPGIAGPASGRAPSTRPRKPARSRGPPLPLPLLEEREVRRGTVSLLSVVSIWKTFTPEVGDEPAHAPVGRVQLGAVLVHEGAALLHGLRVVVVAEAPVAGEPGGHALVAAVHGDQVDVHVDQQVALGGPLVDLDVLALVGEAEVDEAVGVLGVVLGEQAVAARRRRRRGRRARGAARPRSSGGAGRARRSARRRRPRPRPPCRAPASMTSWRMSGRSIGRERQGDVVEGDGELHARRAAAPAGARRRPSGWLSACADGAPRGRRADRAARARRPPGFPRAGVSRREPLAVPEQGGWRRAVDLEHEPGPGAHRSVLSGCGGRRPPSPHRGGRPRRRGRGPPRSARAGRWPRPAGRVRPAATSSKASSKRRGGVGRRRGRRLGPVGVGTDQA